MQQDKKKKEAERMTDHFWTAVILIYALRKKCKERMA
jgi:hypothetical protein